MGKREGGRGQEEEGKQEGGGQGREREGKRLGRCTYART